MGSIENISELCRLCLVKDQVNVPIFEENATKEQTFVKINSCLPVKVSRDDSLPKKICDGCSCKLDMLYTFRNTSVDSEKQLLKWLNQAGLSCSQSAVKDPLASTKPEVTIKQETFEPTDSRDDLGLDTHSYIMQQQKLPYSQEFEFGEPSESNVGLMTDEPAPKKAKRAAALNKASVETDEDDLDAAMQITKAEDEDSDEIDQPEYVEAPSTSADDQPGPSGVNKTTVEAPSEDFKLWNNVLCDKLFYPSNEHSHTPSDYLYENKLVPKSENWSNSEFKCNLCDSTYTNVEALTLHKKIAHEILTFYKEIANKTETFTCEFCSKHYRNYRGFKNHVKQHDPNHIEIKFPCPHCLKLYNKQALKYHIEDKHSVEEGGKYVCHMCGKKMKTYGGFRLHKKIHTGERNFACCECNKAFPTKTGLDNHMISHTKEKRFRCLECNKLFARRSALRVHAQQHAAERDEAFARERPFVCQECAKAFPSRSSLETHLRVHTKEKPFECTECEKAFSQKNSLNIHMRTHTGERPFGCELCNKKFVSRTALNNHKCRVL
nr:PREDICTED: zinc finger protein 160 isoform X14 [Tribolium castaneum]|eukprot:XP_015834129.1 PREDICTED: zinc finger protein 160 isoform X14 [Tribolium castaneum]